MRKPAIARIIGLIVGLAGIAACIWCSLESMAMNKEYHEWMDARPMETTIDLSKPNQVTTEFIQTCHSSHGEAIYLHCGDKVDSGSDPNQLLEGLSGRITISDANGNLVCDTKFPEPRFPDL